MGAGRADISLLAVQRQAAWPWGFQGSMEAPLNGGQSVSRLCMVRCRWRGTSPSPARGQPAIRLDGGERLNAASPPCARGMQRESAASPLPRWCCTTTHILRSTLNQTSGYQIKRCDGSLNLAACSRSRQISTNPPLALNIPCWSDQSYQTGLQTWRKLQ